MKKRTIQTLSVAVAMSVLAACGSTVDAAGGDDVALGDTDVATTAETASDDSTRAETVATATAENVEAIDTAGVYDYDEADVVQISLGTTISATSDTVSIDGTTATITSAGVYEVAGTLNDGQLVVDGGDEAVVQLILNGTDITNADGAAIAVTSAETAVVILADGSSNTLTDGSDYVFADGADEPNATLFSSADLTLGGTGSLTVFGNYNDGIASKDGLAIDGGAITVVAIDDGVRGKDYVVINGGEIDVTAGGTGSSPTTKRTPTVATSRSPMARSWLPRGTTVSRRRPTR